MSNQSVTAWFHCPAKSRNTKGGTGLNGVWGASFPKWRKEGGAQALARSGHLGWACQFLGGSLGWGSLAETGRHKFLTLWKGGGSSVCRGTTEPSPWPPKGRKRLRRHCTIVSIMIHSCNFILQTTQQHIHIETHTLSVQHADWTHSGLVAPAGRRVPSLRRSLWNLLVFPLSLRPALPRARYAHITSFADRTVHLHPVMSQRLRVLNIRIDYPLPAFDISPWVWNTPQYQLQEKVFFGIIDSIFFTKWKA